MPISPNEPDADFRMMTTPSEWPMWPSLPLKKAANKGWHTGVLIVDKLEGNEGTLRFAEGKSLFDRIFVKDTVVVDEAALRKLVADGWRVD